MIFANDPQINAEKNVSYEIPPLFKILNCYKTKCEPCSPCSGHTWQIYFPKWHNMDLPLDGSVKRKMVWESGSTAFKSRHFHLLVWMSTHKRPYTNSLTSEPILNSHGQACCCMFFPSPLSAVITFYIITSLLLIDCPILYSIVLPKGTSSVL